MLTVLVTFVMMKSDVRGQCPGICNGQTYSHRSFDPGDCLNIANGLCSFAMGTNSVTNVGADFSFAGGNGSVTNNQGSFAYGLNAQTNGDYSFSLGNATDAQNTLSFAMGDNVVSSQRLSFTLGAGVVNNQPNSFLLGWANAGEVFYAEETPGLDPKVALFTQNTNPDADFLIDHGNMVQEYCAGAPCQSFPSLSGTNTKWSGYGSSQPFFLPPLDGFGERFQWENYAANFGMIDRDVSTPGSIKDAIIVIDDFNATATSATSNILRVGFRWGDPAGTNGYDSLVHVYPRGNASGNIFEVYGPAGKPGGGSWSGLSDRRVKKNIQPYEDGLEQILQIEPVKYQYNEESGYKTDEEFVGVIAQDMEEIAPYMVNKEGEYLSYNSSALIYMLINAFQEEHERFEEEKAKREKLEARITELEAKYEAVFGSNETSNLPDTNEEISQEVMLSNAGIEEPLLYQNRPNPFRGSTEIGYYIPENTIDAILIITEVETGKVIRRVALNEHGTGTLKVNVENLSAGSYSYTLVIDGQQSLIRQMMLSK